jgi:hypothetical protein
MLPLVQQKQELHRSKSKQPRLQQQRRLRLSCGRGCRAGGCVVLTLYDLQQ